MPITPATVVRNIIFPGVDNIQLFRFTFPSVPSATISNDIEFTMRSPGKIETLRMSCASKNYHFSLRLEPAITPPSIEEFYSVIGISNSYYDDNADIWYAKPLGPSQHKLYGQLKNVDSVNATGVITFEFVIVAY